MSQNFPFIVTAAGNDALLMAASLGKSLRFTHVQIGSGNKVIAGDEVSLLSPEAFASILFGSRVDANTIRVTTDFTIDHDFETSEIGVWIGEPEEESSILFAYYSKESGAFASQEAGIDFSFEFDLIIQASLPVKVEADGEGAIAAILVRQHDEDEDAHKPKFDALEETLDAEVLARVLGDANRYTKQEIDAKIAELSSLSSSFRMVGYVHDGEYSDPLLKVGEKLIIADEMPDVFPVSVKVWDGTAWVDDEDYTPSNFELWANRNDDHGYYWFGGHWNIIDGSGVPDATQQQSGKVRFASDEEAAEGLSENSVITPKQLKQSMAEAGTDYASGNAAIQIASHQISLKLAPDSGLVIGAGGLKLAETDPAPTPQGVSSARLLYFASL